MTAAGALAGVCIVVVAGDRLRSWMVRRFGHRGDGERGRTWRIWERHRVVGWGLLAPLSLGAPLAAALGAGLGARRRGHLVWLGVGVALWTTVLAAIATLGSDAVRMRLSGTWPG